MFQPITVKYVKFNDKLVPATSADKINESLFINTVKDGDKVEVTYEIQNDNHSEGQLKIVHAIIRELSLELGYEFKIMKEMVKKRAGLQIKENKFKSFGKCTKEELSLAIQSALEIQNFTKANHEEY